MAQQINSTFGDQLVYKYLRDLPKGQDGYAKIPAFLDPYMIGAGLAPNVSTKTAWDLIQQNDPQGFQNLSRQISNQETPWYSGPAQIGGTNYDSPFGFTSHAGENGLGFIDSILGNPLTYAALFSAGVGSGMIGGGAGAAEGAGAAAGVGGIDSGSLSQILQNGGYANAGAGAGAAGAADAAWGVNPQGIDGITSGANAWGAGDTPWYDQMTTPNFVSNAADVATGAAPATTTLGGVTSGLSGGGVLGAAALGLSAGAGQAAGSTALSRLLNGTATTEDYLSLGLKALPGVLGAVGANSSAKSLQELANRYSEYGGPSRARYEASYAPGFSMASDPGYTDALNQSAKASMHALSVNGNPGDSPNAWSQSLSDLYQKTAYPALQNYRLGNSAAGGLQNAAAAAPGLATSAIGQQGQVMSNLGGAFNDVTGNDNSLAGILKKLGTAGNIFNVAT